MTSNIGSDEFNEKAAQIGFFTGEKEEEGIISDYANIREKVLKQLPEFFAPEFLNRIDDMIIFHSLTRENIHKIIDLELFKLFARIQDLGYSASMSEKAKDFIVDKGYDEKFGARPLKRAIQKYIEDPLAEEIVKNNLSEGDTIVIDIEEGAAILSLTIAKTPKKSTKK